MSNVIANITLTKRNDEVVHCRTEFNEALPAKACFMVMKLVNDSLYKCTYDLGLQLGMSEEAIDAYIAGDPPPHIDCDELRNALRDADVDDLEHAWSKTMDYLARNPFDSINDAVNAYLAEVS